MYSNTESFVAYCNEMMIATENWKEYGDKIDEIRDEISNINREIRKTDDLRECANYINRSITQLQKLKQELNKIKTGEKLNKFGAGYGLWVKIIETASIIGSILVAIPVGGIVGAGSAAIYTIGNVAGSATSFAIGHFIQKYNKKKLKEKEVTKEDAKTMIDDAIKALTEKEEEINNAIKSGAVTKSDLKSNHKIHH